MKVLVANIRISKETGELFDYPVIDLEPAEQLDEIMQKAQSMTSDGSPAEIIPGNKKPVRDVITYRLTPEDKLAITIYAATNGVKVQDLISQSLRLLAAECDIKLSDEIMNTN